MPKRPRKGDSKYQQYLASREWGLLREAVRKRSANRCEHCFNAPQQAVHHLTYEHLYNEHVFDLLAICNECHEFVSGLAELNPISRWAVVTPAITTPWFEDESYGTLHYFIPSSDQIAQYETPIPGGGFGVKFHICRGEGCLWCSYAFENWMTYLDDLKFTKFRWQRG